MEEEIRRNKKLEKLTKSVEHMDDKFTKEINFTKGDKQNPREKAFY